jgi:membrane-associated phospholipid phosphatase
MVVLRRANFADRLVLAYAAVGGVLILLLRHRVPGWPAFLALHLVLIALVGALVANAGRWRTAHAWYPLALPLILFEEVAALNFLLVDGWRDQYLLAFEAWLFPEPPTVWLGRFASPLVTEILSIGYFSYFLVLIIVAGVFDRRVDKAPFFGVMAASLLGYLVCYAVFIAFPTEGPAHTLRHLHTVPLAGGPVHEMVAYIQANAGVHGNAFPSAHAAGAVAALAFAWRYAPKLAAWLTLPVVLMSIGAVYLRYHYVSDIVAGILIGAGSAAVVLWTQSRPPMATERTATD